MAVVCPNQCLSWAAGLFSSVQLQESRKDYESKTNV